MHYYITPKKDGFSLLKTEYPIPEGSEHEDKGIILRCIHLAYRGEIYGYLVTVGEELDRRQAIDHIRVAHPNPLVIDLS